MTLSQSAQSELLEAFRAGDGVDLIRASARMVMQKLIDLDACQRVGAGRSERCEDRATERNGTRPKPVTKLRKGSFFPTILEPRRRARHQHDGLDGRHRGHLGHRHR